MNAMESLRQWTAAVKQLLAPTHAHQCNALATIAYAMAVSGRSDSGHVPLAMPGKAKPASGRRRMERLLSNPRLISGRVQAQMTRGLLGNWNGPIVLILDETPKGQDLRCMKISLGYRHRAVPLAWECYRPDHPPLEMPRLLWQLCQRVARTIPPALRGRVCLLADRGLAWPTLVDCCDALGWHYVLRLQGSTRVRLPDDDEGRREVWAKDLVPRKGSRWLGRGVELFKKAGWRRANLVAVWERRCREPWLLVTDLHASYARCAGYCKRTWCEQMHRDEKSQGFNWQRSRVADPRHARRLVLLLALATILAISLGTRILKRGLRRRLEATRLRKLSLFQLGMRWLALAAQRDSLPTLPATIYLLPP